MVTFVLVVLVLFLIPGPAVLLTISQSVRGGKKAGMMTGVGIAVGDLIHTISAVLGLSAILLTSALAFETIKYVGAAYLIYLGIKAMFETSKRDDKPIVKKMNPSLSFRQAILIELLNPKTALFFLAFLPQFVRSDGYPVVYQLLILGLTFVLMSILYTTLLALLASSIYNRLLPKIGGYKSHWQGKLVGSIFIGLGVKLAFQHQD